MIRLLMKNTIAQGVYSPRKDAAARKWNAAIKKALATKAAPNARIEAILTVIDFHLNGIAQAPGMWGDVLSAETTMCELLFLRALLLGVSPTRHGGEKFNLAKEKLFGSSNGPLTNWLPREAFDEAAPLFRLAITSERRRMGVPSKVAFRRKHSVKRKRG